MAFASINGQELFFEDSGGDGFPLVMMHGFLMDQSLFDPQVMVLAPQYRCQSCSQNERAAKAIEREEQYLTLPINYYSGS